MDIAVKLKHVPILFFNTEMYYKTSVVLFEISRELNVIYQ